ncbi:zinc-ribbon domain-containing protein [Sphingomonas edaphi]|nr:zinc-ribbon domain-containing protein [Sphingomonas edaphi]
MILTCPACDTKYVVKDGAIPAGGRQVRCASCKHSWHQDPEAAVEESDQVPAGNGGGPLSSPMVEPEAEAVANPAHDGPSETTMSETPQPVAGEHSEAEWEGIDEPARASTTEPPGDYEATPAPVAEDRPPADEMSRWQAPSVAEEDEFVGYAPIGGEVEYEKRRWPLWLALVLLIAAAAAAFWFLAPSEWKARAGIAEASATPLQLMITTRERQPMQSGQELVLLGGRIINPTEKTQRVPPIQVQLRDPLSKTVLHKWTITPPRNELGPGESTNFNSAEVDKQRDGEQLVDIALRQGPA